MGKTRTDAPRSGACIQRVISGESFTGMVLGMAATDGKAARRRRRRARGDGLLVALAGLAQVHVHVDEAGRNGQAGCVQNLGAFGLFQLARTGDLGHAAVLEQNVLERRPRRPPDR